MYDVRTISGVELRYLLSLCLWQRGPMTVRELVEAVAAGGFVLAHRPSKQVSDALRWEVRRGRAVRLGRGRYGPGRTPRSTRDRMRTRIARRQARLDRTVPDAMYRVR